MELVYKTFRNEDIYDLCFEYMDKNGKLKYDNPPCGIVTNHFESFCKECKYSIKDNAGNINILKCTYSFKNFELDRAFILKLERNISGKIIYLKYQKDDNLYEIRRYKEDFLFNDLLSLWNTNKNLEYIICYNINEKEIYKIKCNPCNMLNKYNIIYGFKKDKKSNRFSKYSTKIKSYNNKEWIIIDFKLIK